MHLLRDLIDTCHSQVQAFALPASLHLVLLVSTWMVVKERQLASVLLARLETTAPPLARDMHAYKHTYLTWLLHC
jgi:hypothetical protein